MPLNEFLGTAFDLFSRLSQVALFPPMMALLGIAVLGCIVGIIFYFLE